MLIVALFLAAVPFAMAQDARPQIMPGERKQPPRKKDAGPRALGIIQLGKNGKASLIPVAILINGKFWDASAYKADPVPMALDSGVVYEGERSGSSLGLFTVGSALHSNNPNAAMPWLGTGVWRANGTEEMNAPKKAEAAPAGMSGDSGPPRLTRDPNATKAPAGGSSGSSNAPAPAQPSKPSSGSSDEPPRLSKSSSPSDSSSTSSSPSGNQQPAPASGGSPNSTAPPQQQPSSPSSDSGDGPPRLNRRDSSSGSDSGSSQNSPNTSSSGQSQPSGSKPGDAKDGNAKSGGSGSDAKAGNQAKSKESVAASDSGASETNRPRLRRGKPAESFADEEIPGYSLPGVRPKSTQDAGKLVQTAAANKEDVQLIPAISDESDVHGIAPRSFVFEWIPGEEEDRRKQMLELAQDLVKKYVEARSKNTIPANATASKAGKKLASPKTPNPELENMQMVAYDLWGTNQPVLVLSALAHMPAGSMATQADSDTQYSIVLVAYPDIYHNLNKQFVSITDKFHLDVTPRLELIDAIDADGNGTGELLFRETSDQGSGWVVYRAGADKLVKAFDSLNPE